MQIQFNDRSRNALKKNKKKFELSTNTIRVERAEINRSAENYFRVSSGKKVIGGGLRAIIWLLRGGGYHRRRKDCQPPAGVLTSA